jgi:hypothetical protein
MRGWGMYRLITTDYYSGHKTVGKPQKLKDIVPFLVLYKNFPKMVEYYWLEVA